jgi:hypothetical protein
MSIKPFSGSTNDGKIGIESLEQREVYAAGLTAALDVEMLNAPLNGPAPIVGKMTASVSGGVMTVTSDSNNHSLLVEQLGDGKYKLSGKTDALGAPTTINGQESVVFTGVNKDVYFNLGAGNDTVILQGRDGSHQLKAPRDVFFYGQGGDDNLQMLNVKVGRDLDVNMGGDYSQLGLDHTSVGRDMSFHGGIGFDVAILSDVDVKRNLSVNTYRGNDYLVLYKTQVNGSALFQTGDGEDSVSIASSKVKKELSLDTGAGKDKVVLNTVQADQYFVDLGDGDDSLTLTSIKGKRGTFNGGAGIDAFNAAAKDYKLSKTPSILLFEPQTM